MAPRFGTIGFWVFEGAKNLKRLARLISARLLFSKQETGMRSFIAACIAAVAIAAIGAIVLDFYQLPADVAFTTKSVRL
jgi:hypothetical protein